MWAAPSQMYSTGEAFASLVFICVDNPCSEIERRRPFTIYHMKPISRERSGALVARWTGNPATRVQIRVSSLRCNLEQVTDPSLAPSYRRWTLSGMKHCLVESRVLIQDAR